MESAVVGSEARVQVRQVDGLAKGLLDRLGRQGRVEPFQRGAQASGQEHVAVVAAFGPRLTGGDFRAE